ncbi:hypothetical protein CYMTET_46353 [Cymbomonas tetramitiformis]|uniref:Uncharacterized protein n=1 Tax=Cymbomonas tetramitiformis TaxID=36881 RepID=A0AAE0BWB3_9CHLO|nr:hypothetical protein CYMTET_46353 [Cymbomonas tetramitiformis]
MRIDHCGSSSLSDAGELELERAVEVFETEQLMHSTEIEAAAAQIRRTASDKACIVERDAAKLARQARQEATRQRTAKLLLALQGVRGEVQVQVQGALAAVHEHPPVMPAGPGVGAPTQLADWNERETVQRIRSASDAAMAAAVTPSLAHSLHSTRGGVETSEEQRGAWEWWALRSARRRELLGGAVTVVARIRRSPVISGAFSLAESLAGELEGLRRSIQKAEAFADAEGESTSSKISPPSTPSSERSTQMSRARAQVDLAESAMQQLVDGQGMLRQMCAEIEQALQNICAPAGAYGTQWQGPKAIGGDEEVPPPAPLAGRRAHELWTALWRAQHQATALAAQIVAATSPGDGGPRLAGEGGGVQQRAAEGEAGRGDTAQAGARCKTALAGGRQNTGKGDVRQQLRLRELEMVREEIAELEALLHRSNLGPARITSPGSSQDSRRRRAPVSHFHREMLTKLEGCRAHAADLESKVAAAGTDGSPEKPPSPEGPRERPFPEALPAERASSTPAIATARMEPGPGAPSRVNGRPDSFLDASAGRQAKSRAEAEQPLETLEEQQLLQLCAQMAADQSELLIVQLGEMPPTMVGTAEPEGWTSLLAEDAEAHAAHAQQTVQEAARLVRAAGCREPHPDCGAGRHPSEGAEETVAAADRNSHSEGGRSGGGAAHGRDSRYSTDDSNAEGGTRRREWATPRMRQWLGELQRQMVLAGARVRHVSREAELLRRPRAVLEAWGATLGGQPGNAHRVVEEGREARLREQLAVLASEQALLEAQLEEISRAEGTAVDGGGRARQRSSIGRGGLPEMLCRVARSVSSGSPPWSGEAIRKTDGTPEAGREVDATAAAERLLGEMEAALAEMTRVQLELQVMQLERPLEAAAEWERLQEDLAEIKLHASELGASVICLRRARDQAAPEASIPWADSHEGAHDGGGEVGLSVATEPLEELVGHLQGELWRLEATMQIVEPPPPDVLAESKGVAASLEEERAEAGGTERELRLRRARNLSHAAELSRELLQLLTYDQMPSPRRGGDDGGNTGDDAAVLREGPITEGLQADEEAFLVPSAASACSPTQRPCETPAVPSQAGAGGGMSEPSPGPDPAGRPVKEVAEDMSIAYHLFPGGRMQSSDSGEARAVIAPLMVVPSLTAMPLSPTAVGTSRTSRRPSALPELQSAPVVPLEEPLLEVEEREEEMVSPSTVRAPCKSVRRDEVRQAAATRKTEVTALTPLSEGPRAEGAEPEEAGQSTQLVALLHTVEQQRRELRCQEEAGAEMRAALADREEEVRRLSCEVEQYQQEAEALRAAESRCSSGQTKQLQLESLVEKRETQVLELQGRLLEREAQVRCAAAAVLEMGRQHPGSQQLGRSAEVREAEAEAWIAEAEMRAEKAQAQARDEEAAAERARVVQRSAEAALAEELERAARTLRRQAEELQAGQALAAENAAEAQVELARRDGVCAEVACELRAVQEELRLLREPEEMMAAQLEDAGEALRAKVEQAAAAEARGQKGLEAAMAVAEECRVAEADMGRERERERMQARAAREKLEGVAAREQLSALAVRDLVRLQENSAQAHLQQLAEAEAGERATVAAAQGKLREREEVYVDLVRQLEAVQQRHLESERWAAEAQQDAYERREAGGVLTQRLEVAQEALQGTERQVADANLRWRETELREGGGREGREAQRVAQEARLQEARDELEAQRRAAADTLRSAQEGAAAAADVIRRQEATEAALTRELAAAVDAQDGERQRSVAAAEAAAQEIATQRGAWELEVTRRAEVSEQLQRSEDRLNAERAEQERGAVAAREAEQRCAEVERRLSLAQEELSCSQVEMTQQVELAQQTVLQRDEVMQAADALRREGGEAAQRAADWSEACARDLAEARAEARESSAAAQAEARAREGADVELARQVQLMTQELADKEELLAATRVQAQEDMAVTQGSLQLQHDLEAQVTRKLQAAQQEVAKKERELAAARAREAMGTSTTRRQLELHAASEQQLAQRLEGAHEQLRDSEERLIAAEEREREFSAKALREAAECRAARAELREGARRLEAAEKELQKKEMWWEAVQEEVREKDERLEVARAELQKAEGQLETAQEAAQEELREELRELEGLMETAREEVREKEGQVEEMRLELQENEELLEAAHDELLVMQGRLQAVQAEAELDLPERELRLEAVQGKLRDTERQLESALTGAHVELQEKGGLLQGERAQPQEKEGRLQAAQEELPGMEGGVQAAQGAAQEELGARERLLEAVREQLREKEGLEAAQQELLGMEGGVQEEMEERERLLEAAEKGVQEELQEKEVQLEAVQGKWRESERLLEAAQEELRDMGRRAESAMMGARGGQRELKDQVKVAQEERHEAAGPESAQAGVQEELREKEGWPEADQEEVRPMEERLTAEQTEAQEERRQGEGQREATREATRDAPQETEVRSERAQLGAREEGRMKAAQKELQEMEGRLGSARAELWEMDGRLARAQAGTLDSRAASQHTSALGQEIEPEMDRELKGPEEALEVGERRPELVTANEGEYATAAEHDAGPPGAEDSTLRQKLYAMKEELACSQEQVASARAWAMTEVEHTLGTLADREAELKGMQQAVEEKEKQVVERERQLIAAEVWQAEVMRSQEHAAAEAARSRVDAQHELEAQERPSAVAEAQQVAPKPAEQVTAKTPPSSQMESEETEHLLSQEAQPPVGTS